jgi:GNAT superfamily N-acetyltransferase
MEVEIRKAILDDLPDLLRFEQGVINAERPHDPTLKPDPLHYYDIPTLIESDDTMLAVAVIGQRIVGCGYARIEPAKHYLKHKNRVYLGFMYVDPSYRGKGVIQEIIKVLGEWAITKGETELRLDVYHSNEAAIKAYEKAGFMRHMIEMRLSIDSKAD